MSDDSEQSVEQQVAATTPPVGISSRMIFSVVLIAIAGYASVSAGVIIFSRDTTLITGIVKSWEWGFTLALGYILGSSAGSRNKDGGR